MRSTRWESSLLHRGLPWPQSLQHGCSPMVCSFSCMSHSLFCRMVAMNPASPFLLHPYFIQGPTAFAPMAYDAPAFPRVLCFASICRSWFQSTVIAIRNRLYVNTQRLLQVARLRHDTAEWLHLPNEDRVRFRSWLIIENILFRVVAPLQD